MALYPGMHRRSQPLGHREHQVEELGRRATREANHLHDDVVWRVDRIGEATAPTQLGRGLCK